MWFEGEKNFSKLSAIQSKFLSTLFEERLDFLFSFYKNDIQLLYREAIKEFAAKHVKIYYSGIRLLIKKICLLKRANPRRKISFVIMYWLLVIGDSYPFDNLMWIPACSSVSEYRHLARACYFDSFMKIQAFTHLSSSSWRTGPFKCYSIFNTDL